MIEELLRLAVIEGKRVIDHHEIHIGVTPIDQRVAEEKKRCREAGDDRRQPPSPAEKGQRRKRIEALAGLRLGLCSQCRGLIHAGGLLTHDPETEPFSPRRFCGNQMPKAQRDPAKGLGLLDALAQRNDKIRSLAGFASRDALIGDDDRSTR